jgi:uncharacterized protein (DUF2141 family)
MGARVVARKLVTTSGRRLPIGAGMSEVDDRGSYRIFSLAPGEYIVSVAPPTGLSLNEMYLAGAATAGGAPQLARYTRVAAPGPASSFGYVTTFFPGGTTMSSAATITLAAGETRSGIDLRLQRVPLARVTGTVRDIDGTVPRGDVRLLSLPTTPHEGDGVAQIKPIEADGRFAFPAVAPGQYLVSVRVRVAPGALSPDLRWAMQDLSVSGGLVDLVLTLQLPMTVSGALATDTGALPETLPNVVRFTPIGETRWVVDSAVQQIAPVTADGRFTATSLLPGHYAVSVIPADPEWRLASAIFGARDALDFMLDVRPGESPLGQLTLTKRRTELSGTVVDASNTAATGWIVIVFAADERYWLPENRRNRAAQPDAQGRFVFDDLPPGAYRLAAIDDYDPVAGLDAELLRALAAAPTIPVTLAVGERKVQIVRGRAR